MLCYKDKTFCNQKCANRSCPRNFNDDVMAASKLISMLENQGEVSNEAIQPIMPAGVSACSPEGQKIKAEHEAKKSGGCGSGCGCH